MIKKLQNIDRRIIYLVMLIALAFPMFKPVGMPFTIEQPAINFYNDIENLPADANVLLTFDFSPSGDAQFTPQVIAVGKHLAQIKADRGIKITMVSFWPQGPMYAQRMINDVWADADMVCGENYVNMGYLAGGVPAISAFAASPQKAIPSDVNGTNSNEIPLLADINDASDYDLMIALSSGTPGYKEHVQQVVETYGTKMIGGLNSVSVAGAQPYYNTGQIRGFLNGLRGCAEYESLTGFLGAGTTSVDSISGGHIALIVFILIGNIAYFLDRDKGRG